LSFLEYTAHLLWRIVELHIIEFIVLKELKEIESRETTPLKQEEKAED